MRKIRLLLFIFIILGTVFYVFPQENLKETKTTSSQVIDYLEFKKVDIKDVLKQLAKQYNLNIIFSKSVEGLITIQLQKVTIEQALDAIITINGFAYTKVGNIIRVTTPEEAKKIQLPPRPPQFPPQEVEGVPVPTIERETRYFRLKNADASKLKDTLKEFLSPGGSIEAEVRTNSLVVTDTPQSLNKIEKAIPGLDEALPQVLIEAKFIETSLGVSEKLGIEWTLTATASGSFRKTTLPFDAKDSGSWLKGILPAVSPGNSDFPAPYSFPYAIKDNFTFGTLDFRGLKVVMDFLKQKTNSKLISSPRVVTMDNKEAEIYVGKSRPIPTFSYNVEQNTYQITGFTEKIEGVILKVTPQVSKGEGEQYHVRLKLTPKVTSYSDKVTFAALGFDYPILSERYADTEVTIKDGDTIVIGGLIETKKTEAIHKVPFLGDIPLLGRLFTHKEVDPDSKTELLIFVTAHVVKENLALAESAQKKMEFAEGTRPFKLKLREITLPTVD